MLTDEECKYRINKDRSCSPQLGNFKFQFLEFRCTLLCIYHMEYYNFNDDEESEPHSNNNIYVNIIKFIILSAILLLTEHI